MAEEVGTEELAFAEVASVEPEKNPVSHFEFSVVLTPNERARIYLCLASLISAGNTLAAACSVLITEYNEAGQRRTASAIVEFQKVVAGDFEDIKSKRVAMKELWTSAEISIEEITLLMSLDAVGKTQQELLRAAAEIAKIVD